MSLELVIFLIVAAIAIFAATFMLVSRNAVHSALFLVINMICLAFFYLLLNAPFLAMVQITVYAGAIMVLFMFVIMLLGADRLDGEPTRYRWLPIGAVGLTTLFLLTAFLAVVQGNVDLLKPIPHAPQVRVVDAAPDQPPLSVYLNNDKLTTATYGTTDDFAAVRPGDYNAAVFAIKADGGAIDPGKDKPLSIIPLHLTTDTNITLVATADRLIVVPQDLSSLADDTQFRYTAVDALPGSAKVNLLRVDPTDVKNNQIVAPALNYGDVSKAAALPTGSYQLAWQVEGSRAVTTADQTIAAQTYPLYILAPQFAGDGKTLIAGNIRVDAKIAPTFGSPQNIGEQLFNGYLLPFELVSLLLLAAMVGAIILTREEVIKRERKRLVVSQQVARLNAAARAANTAPATLSVGAEPGGESATR
jgi:NADH:ubiquinone oxidoreductase subunit 6 (subunit J)